MITKEIIQYEGIIGEIFINDPNQHNLLHFYGICDDIFDITIELISSVVSYKIQTDDYSQVEIIKNMFVIWFRNKVDGTFL